MMIDFIKNGSLNFIESKMIPYAEGEFMKVTAKFSWLSEVPKLRKEGKYNDLWIEATGNNAKFINSYFNDKDYVTIQGNIETYTNPETSKQTVKVIVQGIRNLTKEEKNNLTPEEEKALTNYRIAQDRISEEG